MQALVQPVTATPAKGQHFEELEAYRGIAALLIVIFHAYQYSRQATHQPTYVYEGTPAHNLLANLEAGVAWFFALSGFLLFLPIARYCIAQTPRPSTRSFLIRRAIRILPLYYFAILVVWSWRFTGGPGQWRDLFNHLTFTHVFSDQQLFWTIGPAWSLAVEVHFYVALALTAPVIYWLCSKLSRNSQRTMLVFGFVCLLWAGGVAYLWWVENIAHIPHARSSMYFSLPAKLDNFAAGMFLAAIAASTNDRILISRTVAWMLRLFGIGMIALTFLTRDSTSVAKSGETVDIYFHSISAVAFTLVIASSVIGQRTTAWTSILTRPSLQMLGLLSYSIYMWHEPILIELGQRGRLISQAPSAFPVNTIILIALSVAMAWGSYWAIERPTMELRHLFGPTGRLAGRYQVPGHGHARIERPPFPEAN